MAAARPASDRSDPPDRSRPPTANEALARAAAALRAAGIERGRPEAELLLAHVLTCRRVALLAHPERLLSPEQAAAFEQLIARRAARVPLPYLIGEREFMGLRFMVNEHVLIPRPETEELVEEAAAFLKRSAPPVVAIDAGTGSGAIAVSLAALVRSLRVYATDVSPEACAVARENARRLGVADRVEVFEGDLLAPLADACGRGRPASERAAALCANLPYVPDESLPGLEPEVRAWEPRLALAGGPGGLEVIERLVRQAVDYLRPAGRIFLEIGPEADQPARLTALLSAAGWQEIEVRDDLAGLPRVVSATAPGQ